MQWALPNKYSCVIPQESRYEILPWHQASLITSIITTPPLHTPAPCNHWSDFYPSSFMFSKMFYEWNHTACSPLYWLLSPSSMLFHTSVGHSFLLLRNTFYCVDVLQLIYSLVDDHLGYFQFFVTMNTAVIFVNRSLNEYVFSFL